MTDSELKRLKRSELVEIIHELEKSAEDLRAERDELERRLADRRLKIENAGSIADAVLTIGDIFNRAQAAADEYLAQIHASNAEMEKRYDEVIAEAERKADAMVALAEAQCRSMQEETDRKVTERWERCNQNVQQAIQAHAELRAILGEDAEKPSAKLEADETD